MVNKFEIETDDWTIGSGGTLNENCEDGYIQPIFRVKDSMRRNSRVITQEDLNDLLEDLKDLGKWRKFKKLKKELNS